MEHMDHDIHEVQECPSSSLESLHMVSVAARLPHRFHNTLSERSNVGIGRAGCDHEEIRRVADLAQVEDNHLLGLVRLESFQDEGQSSASIGLYPIVAPCGGNRSQRLAKR